MDYIEINKLQKQINELYEALQNEVGSSKMDMIERLVQLNIEIECNQ